MSSIPFFSITTKARSSPSLSPIPLMTSLLLTLLAVLSFYQISSSASKSTTYDVVKLGARGDGKTDTTKYFLKAWSAACRSTDATIIYVPPGRYLVGNAVFDGEKCKNSDITFSITGSTLVAPANYKASNWILFKAVNGVTITGGKLDGQGTGLWACKNSGKSCPNGATSLEFSNSLNITINGLLSVNSQKFHIKIEDCKNVMIQGVKISADGNSPNTDGIHLASSSVVTIQNSRIATGDDCISIGPGTNNTLIESIACGPGHGISIGSLGQEENERGVQNVTVTGVHFTGTTNGVRIKTWANSNTGFVRNVVFQHVTMNNVNNPVIIDQNYCPEKKHCPHQDSAVKISDVTYQDIRGSSATPVGVKFECSRKYPCSGLKLDQVKLTYNNQVAKAVCSNIAGISPYGVLSRCS